jgi:hypothetical protein
LYQTAVNFIKQKDINFNNTLLAYRKLETSGFSYKVVYTDNSVPVISNRGVLSALETVIYIDPINKVLNTTEDPIKLNLTTGFQAILTTSIQQQDLVDIGNQFFKASNLTNQQMIITKVNRKDFLDGNILSIQFSVKFNSNLTIDYLVTSFKRYIEVSYTVWNVRLL